MLVGSTWVERKIGAVVVEVITECGDALGGIQSDWAKLRGTWVHTWTRKTSCFLGRSANAGCLNTSNSHITVGPRLQFRVRVLEAAILALGAVEGAGVEPDVLLVRVDALGVGVAAVDDLLHKGNNLGDVLADAGERGGRLDVETLHVVEVLGLPVGGRVAEDGGVGDGAAELLVEVGGERGGDRCGGEEEVERVVDWRRILWANLRPRSLVQ